MTLVQMALILSKLNLQMALYSVRVDPYFEGLIYPEKQTGSHKVVSLR